MSHSESESDGFESMPTQDDRLNSLTSDDVVIDMPPILKLEEPNNGWTLSITRDLQKYLVNSAGLAWQHGEDAAYYHGRNGWWTLRLAIASAIAAAFFGFIGATVSNDGPTWLFWTLTIIGALTNMVMAGVNAFLNTKDYGDKIAENSEKSRKFAELYRSGRTQFSRDTKDRINARVFQDEVLSRFNELDGEKPFIRASSVAGWYDQCHKIEDTGEIDFDSILAMPEEFRQGRQRNINQRPIGRKSGNRAMMFVNGL